MEAVSWERDLPFELHSEVISRSISKFTNYLFTLTRSNTIDDSVVFIEDDGGDTGEHFLEMLLQAGNVLAVADDFQQIFVTHEVESM